MTAAAGRPLKARVRHLLRQSGNRVLGADSPVLALLAELTASTDDVITMGRWTYFDGRPKVHRYPAAPGERIVVGAFCSIAKDVSFVLGGNHDPRRVTTSPVRTLLRKEDADITGEITGRGSIVIGNDVWIGRGAMLLSGTQVGDGAVIGARSVVSGTVAPYSIVVGNPSRVIRSRFDEATVARLLASSWWDLPDPLLLAAVDLLSSTDIEAFLTHVESLRP